MIIKEKYSLDGVVKKAGNKLIIDLGRMIGSQVALEKEEYERDLDIYQDYARTFKNEITLTIPEGYKVEDVSAFNVKIDNESGLFECTAVVEGDKLILKTSKIYKTNYLPADKWPLMTAFLDEAYNLTQKKLLLTKK